VFLVLVDIGHLLLVSTRSR